MNKLRYHGYHPGRIAARLVMNLPESVRQTLGTLRQWPIKHVPFKHCRIAVLGSRFKTKP